MRWGCAQIYAVVKAEAGKVVGVAVEGLAVEYLVPVIVSGDTVGRLDIPDDECAG